MIVLKTLIINPMKNNSILIFISVVFIISCSNYTEKKPIVEQLVNVKSDTFIISAKTENRSISDSPVTVWPLIEKKAEWFKKGASQNTDLKNIPDNFLTFHKKFISDSIFQRRHIDFKTLIGVLGQCDTTIIYNTSNWVFTNWDFIKAFPIDNFTKSRTGYENYFYTSPNKFYYEFRVKEVGLIRQTGFELINGDWMLTLYDISEC